MNRFSLSNLTRLIDPARLSLLASMLLMAMAIAMAWSGFRGNASVRQLEMQQIETAIHAAFSGMALKVPAAIEIAKSDLAFVDPGSNSIAAIFYNAGAGSAEFLSPADALLTPGLQASALIAKIEPQLKKLAGADNLRLRGSLPLPAAPQKALTVHQDDLLSGFLVQDRHTLAFVALPASRSNANGDIVKGALLAVGPAKMDCGA